MSDEKNKNEKKKGVSRRGITEYKVTDTSGNTVVVKSVSWDSKGTTSSAENNSDKVSKSGFRPREKVAVERGFSMLHWYQRINRERAKMGSSSDGHSGHRGGGGLRKIPMSEVRKHRTRDSAWTVLRGKVYDMTPYLRYHPGGIDKLMMGAGRDMTSLFDKYHSWVNVDFILGTTCYLGDLANDESEENQGAVNSSSSSSSSSPIH